MDIERIAVVGGGQMGSGIAHVFAQAGFTSRIIDVNQEVLDKAMASIEKNMLRQVKKEVLSETDMKAALGRLSTSQTLDDASDCQLAVEAVTEDLELKSKIFTELDKTCPPEAILASNTSSLPIKTLALATQRAPQVIGMHFMNPVPVIKLVEIIRADETSDATYETVRRLTEKLGKIPVTSQDAAGFIANRVLMPMINEACYALMDNVATAEDIDTVMTLGMGHPMGPLKLADFIGLDTCVSILQVMEEGLGDPKYRPCPLLREKVKAGNLGRKTGKGIYNWEKKK